ITDATFTVRAQGQEEQVPGVVTYSGMVAKFKSAEKLAYRTTYTAVISAGVEDLAGNALEADHTWSFTTGIAPDLTPPEVISTEPGNNTNDVAMDTTISATFSENIHPSSVSTDSFFVNDGIHYLQGTVTYYNKVVTFTPAEKLTPDTLFIATVTTDTRDFAGNHLETDYIWSFKTGVQPIVKSVTPADNETDVAVNAYVTATFSEPVKPSTINSSTFFLSSESGYISGTVSYSDTTAFFTPSENLADDTIYTATVTAGVENLAGNYLEADYTWSFKTGVRPIVKSVTPADNETG
ncbi:MAG: Ig-like domain-containing protein, partial [Desulfobacteraceae bacterium]|nr:Ig-like domain-containing protein [Desulfobacteraceae bacterium]